MFDQIKGTGAYSDPVSRLYAATVKAFYVNLADRNGTTPMEEYQKNPYKVEMGELLNSSLSSFRMRASIVLIIICHT